jgi:hypothetical protein
MHYKSATITVTIMNKTAHTQIKHLKTKEIQRMSNDEIIKHVYIEHKRARISVDEVWDELVDNFGKQTINDMLGGSEDSLNSNESFDGDSKFGAIIMVYILVFGFIWFILDSLMHNKFEALQFVIVICGIASTMITILFMNVTGKNERNYLNAVNKLRRAYSIYINKGFNDLMGKPLDYVKDND